MNDDFDHGWTRDFDTPDLLEGITIAGLAFSAWQDECTRMRMSGEVFHFQRITSGKSIRTPGFPPEPRMTFNGKIVPISTVVGFALAIDRPAPLTLRYMISRGFLSQDGEEIAPMISDVADYLSTAIDALLEANEDHKPAPAPAPTIALDQVQITGLFAVCFSTTAKTIENQVRMLAGQLPSTIGGQAALLAFADHLHAIDPMNHLPETVA